MRLKVFFGACLALLTALYAWPLSWTPVGQLKQFYQPAPRLSGTIWKGRISGLHNIDNLDIATSLKALLTGQLPISFSSAQPAMQLRGHIGFGHCGSVRIRYPISVLLKRAIWKRDAKVHKANFRLMSCKKILPCGNGAGQFSLAR